MSIGSINSSSSTMQTQQTHHQRRPEPPLKEQVDGMSQEDRSEFNSQFEALSNDQKSNFMSLMKDNESDISQMSQEEASSAILDLLGQAAQSTSTTSSTSQTDSTFSMEGVSGKGSMPPPPPPPRSGGEAQDPSASLGEDSLTKLLESLDSMTTDQKKDFGFSLMQSKDELSSMDSTQASDLIMSLLDEAKNSTSSTTSSQYSGTNVQRGGSFLDMYS